mmetsp:Transcript_115816/g.368224  ORF Transcript_115816/g.368224 Transcript_115816/m.368224 type:complete len:203 (-) Transcript_115816:3007-3615(-)
MFAELLQGRLGGGLVHERCLTENICSHVSTRRGQGGHDNGRTNITVELHHHAEISLWCPGWEAKAIHRDALVRVKHGSHLPATAIDRPRVSTDELLTHLLLHRILVAAPEVLDVQTERMRMLRAANAADGATPVVVEDCASKAILHVQAVLARPIACQGRDCEPIALDFVHDHRGQNLAKVLRETGRELFDFGCKGFSIFAP